MSENKTINPNKINKICLGVGILFLVAGFIFWFVMTRMIIGTKEPVSTDPSVSQTETTVATETPYHRNEVLAATGVDTARVRADTQAINGVYNVIFNWGDGVSYNQARELLLTYMSEEEANRMMPENVIITPQMIDTLTHDTYYVDLMGYNCEFISSRNIVSSFNAETQVYSYISIVEVNSTSDTGNEGSAKYIITFDTDVNSNISNMTYDAIR